MKCETCGCESGSKFCSMKCALERPDILESDVLKRLKADGCVK